MVNVLIYILMLFIFSTPVLTRHLWQLKTVVFLHRCLFRAVLIKRVEAQAPLEERTLIKVENVS